MNDFFNKNYVFIYNGNTIFEKFVLCAIFSILEPLTGFCFVKQKKKSPQTISNYLSFQVPMVCSKLSKHEYKTLFLAKQNFLSSFTLLEHQSMRSIGQKLHMSLLLPNLFFSE